MTTLKTRFIGFCPICEGDFKLLNQRLVHHGYRRPGWGYIVGDCPSVHELPYELSNEVCKKYQEDCRNALQNTRTYLVRLQAGEVKTLQVPDYSKGYNRDPDMMEITVVYLAFHQAWEGAIYVTTHRIQKLESEIERMQSWIDTWTLKPVRTFEEGVAAKRAAVSVRKAEAEAKRAVKRAKEAALKAKYAAWEEEKKTLMAKYKGAFLELSEKPTANIVLLEARRLYAEMRKAQGKKGYLHFYYRELEITDQVWVDLGLAAWDSRPGLDPFLRFKY